MPRPLIPLLATLCTACIPQDQSSVCAEYVSCIQARDARDGTTTDLVRFTPEGDCWAIDAGADLCTRGCEAGLEYLRSHESNLPAECNP